MNQATSCRSRRLPGRVLRAGASCPCRTGRRRPGSPDGRPIPGCAARPGSGRGSRTRSRPRRRRSCRWGTRPGPRRVAQVGAVPAGDFLGQQDPHDLGGVPALGLGGGEDLGGSAADVRELAAGVAVASRSAGPAVRRWTGDRRVARRGRARVAAEGGPAGGARARVVVLAGPGELRPVRGRPGGRGSRSRSLLAESAGGRGLPQCPVDVVGRVQAWPARRPGPSSPGSGWHRPRRPRPATAGAGAEGEERGLSRWCRGRGVGYPVGLARAAGSARPGRGAARAGTWWRATSAGPSSHGVTITAPRRGGGPRPPVRPAGAGPSTGHLRTRSSQSQFTRRVVPNAAVNGAAAAGAAGPLLGQQLGGTRRVSRWGRVLTSLAELAAGGLQLGEGRGTRPAGSPPSAPGPPSRSGPWPPRRPWTAGSAGTQVAMVIP